VAGRKISTVDSGGAPTGLGGLGLDLAVKDDGADGRWMKLASVEAEALNRLS